MAIQEREERETGWAPELFHQFFSPGRIQLLLILAFLHGDSRNDKVFLEYQARLCGLDKPIEFMTPASPRCVKKNPNDSMAICRFRLSLPKNVVGGQLLLSRRQIRGQEQHRRKTRQHGPILAPQVPMLADASVRSITVYSFPRWGRRGWHRKCPVSRRNTMYLGEVQFVATTMVHIRVDEKT